MRCYFYFRLSQFCSLLQTYFWWLACYNFLAIWQICFCNSIMPFCFSLWWKCKTVITLSNTWLSPTSSLFYIGKILFLPSAALCPAFPRPVPPHSCLCLNFQAGVQSPHTFVAQFSGILIALICHMQAVCCRGAAWLPHLFLAWSYCFNLCFDLFWIECILQWLYPTYDCCSVLFMLL